MAWKIPNKIIFKASLFHAASLKVSMAGPEQVNHYNITFVFVSEFCEFCKLGKKITDMIYSTQYSLYLHAPKSVWSQWKLEVMQPLQSAIVATFRRKLPLFPLRKHITTTKKVNNIKSINVNMVGPELGREKQDVPTFCSNFYPPPVPAYPDLELEASQLSGVH